MSGFFPPSPSGVGGGLTSIARQTLSGVGSFTFTGLSPAFGLMVMAYVRSNAAAASDKALIRFNNDTAANYSYQDVSGAAAVAAASSTSAQTGITTICVANTGNAGYTTMQFWIPIANGNQQSSTVCHGQTGFMVSADNRAIGFAGLWAGTALINRIDLLPQTGTNFMTGSMCAIYAI